MTSDSYNERETGRRREAALKRMLSTPPVRHAESKAPRKPGAKSAPAKPKSAGA